MDRSEGWDEVAEQFMVARSSIGASFIRSWARDNLPRGGSVVDIGCGSGVPIAQALFEEGFDVSGIDASSRLIAEFRRRFPDAQADCEAAQESAFLHRTFDGAIAIGLVFLLTEDNQRKVIGRVASALRPGGRFLFSAPRENCKWRDMLTGRGSLSLGADEYERLLQSSGFQLVGCHLDDGQNKYYDALKPPS